MNLELLEQVKAAILAEPHLFNMDDFICRGSCGTEACIAGWAVKLSDPATFQYAEGLSGTQYTNDLVLNAARSALQLRWDEAARLFWLISWPPSFRSHDHEARSPQDHAQAAANRIDHFIATKGQE